MKPDLKQQAVQQLETLTEEARSTVASSKYDDLSDLQKDTVQKVLTMQRAAIIRWAGRETTYSEDLERVLSSKDFPGNKLIELIGIVNGLCADIKAGFLENATELIHADLFSDFLDMADHLLEEGYKDPAAVVAGSSLESHLRQLCDKAGIVTTQIVSGKTRPKKADALNAELLGTGIYEKLDQKNVTAWLDLRNKAAHGEYGIYSNEQVKLLISGVRDFITRNPA